MSSSISFTSFSSRLANDCGVKIKIYEKIVDGEHTLYNHSGYHGS